MRSERDIRKKWQAPLVVSLMVILIISGIAWYEVLDFNNTLESITGDVQDSAVTFVTDIDADKGERWNSEIPISSNPRTTLMYVGETVTGTLSNTNSYDIVDWTLKVSPKTECYLNGFWGGSMEIHQFREGEEIVETIEKIVGSAEIEKLEVNPYMDVMMIHFQPGDYFIFHPMVGDEGARIKAGTFSTVVLNIYYKSKLDFSDFEVCFHNDIKFNATWVYPVLIVIWILWTICLVFYHAFLLADMRMDRETHSSMKSISVMADLYLETYILNLEKQSVYLIKGDKENSLLKLKDGEIQEALNEYVDTDCQQAYAQELREFLDLSTIKDRMQDISSSVIEYRCKSIGWCSLRIFKLARKKEAAQYILTIQDINNEKKKLQEVEDHIRQQENNIIIQGSFLDNSFFAMNELVRHIRDTSGALAAMLSEPEQKFMAQAINDNIEHLHLLESCTYDLFTLDTPRFMLRKVDYNIREMVDKLSSMLKPFYMGRAYEFQIDIDPQIPDKLRGDKERIMQILVVLLFSSLFITEKGFVKLSVYGKQTENKEELIFSVRDTASGFTEEQVMEIQEVFRESKLKPLDNASLVYLQIMNQILRKMNSEMKLVSVLGSGSEFYFSIEQEVVNE